MRRSLRIFAFITAITGIVMNFGCSHVTSPYNSNPPPLSSTEKQVASATSSFALNLFDQVAVQEQGKNFFISPLSVSMALAMTLNGANGQTYTDMQNTLGLSGLNNDEINKSYQTLMARFTALDPNVTFNIANSIWYRNTFSVIDTFLTVDQTYFNADVKPLDFSDPNAANTINSWISDKTNGKIPSVISPPINAGTVMFLINALYFNGTWKYEFDPANTTNQPFYLLSGASENVATMMVRDTLKYCSDSVFQVVELPYGNGDYSMLVLLPSSKSSFSNAEASLNQTEVNSIINGLTVKDVEVSLPKFKVEYNTELIPALTKMGMGIAFELGLADFTRINRDTPLVITHVLHDTYVDVNEKGTEAAAVTVVVIGIGAVEEGIPFDVDRPFLFLIKENLNNTVMFMGAVVDPTVVSEN